MSLPTSRTGVSRCWESAHAGGAIAIARLESADRAALDALLGELTGTRALAAGSIAHRSLADIDDGIVARLGERSALVMPHGGPRIVAALERWLVGRCSEAVIAPVATYPEATDLCEALALATIACGASPRAIPLLLAQAQRQRDRAAESWSTADRDRAKRMSALLAPVRVVAVGAANVGKSSLLNAIAGRTVAIAMDFEGTTRDAVAARVELDGLIVDWFDTPGIRATDDPVERSAQSLASRLREGASLFIEISAPGIPCPAVDGAIARRRVCTRIDLDPARASAEARHADCCVSATERTGLTDLARAVRGALVSDADLESAEPWLFDERLVRVP